VELAGALTEIANQTLKHDFRSISSKDARIIVVDSGSRVLASYPEDLSKRAEKQLVRLGARVRTGVTVTGVDEDGVTLKTSTGGVDHIASHTVIWAAGVAVTEFARTLAKRTSAETDRVGHIKVAPDLTIPNFPDIYIVGDLALIHAKDGKPLPGVAQVAMQGGAYAARAIIGTGEARPPLPPFQYFNKGDLAVIGRFAAVADIFGVHVSGFMAWLVWLFVHLMYIVEFQSRLLVFIEWGFLYLTFNRGARLITGSAASKPSGKPLPLEELGE